MLMEFYRSGREGGKFDQGVEMALARILASPQFIYRIEEDDSAPAGRASAVAANSRNAALPSSVRRSRETLFLLMLNA